MVWAGARLPDSTCWMMDSTAVGRSLPSRVNGGKRRHHVGRFLHVIEAKVWPRHPARQRRVRSSRSTPHASKSFKANTASNCRPLSSMVSTATKASALPQPWVSISRLSSQGMPRAPVHDIRGCGWSPTRNRARGHRHRLRRCGGNRHQAGDDAGPPLPRDCESLRAAH